MNLYTIGFTQKTAQAFFETLRSHKIDLVLDIRLNNHSQLAGFSKEDDLRYFLQQLCHCDYLHCPDYAPTREILDNYKKKVILWREYEIMYHELMASRNNAADFAERCAGYENVCLLCSEAQPEHCHRRLLAEIIIAADPKIRLEHL